MVMKLNRQIGYVKEELKKDLKGEGISKIEINEIPNLIKVKSKKITDWIKSHPAIKWTIICEMVNIDKGNFHRILKSENPKIKIEDIIKLEKELKQYGYE